MRVRLIVILVLTLLQGVAVAGAQAQQIYRGHIHLEPGDQVRLHFVVHRRAHYVSGVGSGKIPLSCNHGTASKRVLQRDGGAYPITEHRTFGIGWGATSSNGYRARFNFRGRLLKSGEAHGAVSYFVQRSSGKRCSTDGPLGWTAKPS